MCHAEPVEALREHPSAGLRVTFRCPVFFQACHAEPVEALKEHPSTGLRVTYPRTVLSTGR